MAMSSAESSRFTLSLTEEERTQLLALLERARQDTHVEARRTENPAYQEQIHHHESVLRGLIDKVRRS